MGSIFLLGIGKGGFVYFQFIGYFRKLVEDRHLQSLNFDVGHGINIFIKNFKQRFFLLESVFFLLPLIYLFQFANDKLQGLKNHGKLFLIVDMDGEGLGLILMFEYITIVHRKYYKLI